MSNELIWRCPYCENGYNAPSLTHCGNCGEIKPLAVALVDAPEFVHEMRKNAKKGAGKAKRQAEETKPHKDLEGLFFRYWEASNTGYTLLRQHRGIVKRFDKKGKPVFTNHKFDFALESHALAIEIQGGIFGGRHTRSIGYHKDREKIRKASLQGWTVWEYTTLDITESNLHNVVNEILEKIAQIENVEKRRAA